MTSDNARVPDHTIDEKRLEHLRSVLTADRLRIVQQILASSTGALSLPELGARNSITESEIGPNPSVFTYSGRAMESPKFTNVTSVLEPGFESTSSTKSIPLTRFELSRSSFPSMYSPLHRI